MNGCYPCLQEGDSSLSGSIEWEDFLVMMRPVVAQEYRKEAEAMLADTPAALREVTEVRDHIYPEKKTAPNAIRDGGKAKPGQNNGCQNGCYADHVWTTKV